jgi:hypothetical protein
MCFNPPSTHTFVYLCELPNCSQMAPSMDRQTSLHLPYWWRNVFKVESLDRSAFGGDFVGCDYRMPCIIEEDDPYSPEFRLPPRRFIPLSRASAIPTARTVCQKSFNTTHWACVKCRDDEVGCVMLNCRLLVDDVKSPCCGWRLLLPWLTWKTTRYPGKNNQ